VPPEVLQGARLHRPPSRRRLLHPIAVLASHLAAVAEVPYWRLTTISRSFTNFTQLLLYKTRDGRAAREWLQEASMSLLARLHRMNAELSEGENDP